MTSRKGGRCVVSKREYNPGAIVFRPVRDSSTRYKRILAEIVDAEAAGR